MSIFKMISFNSSIAEKDWRFDDDGFLRVTAHILKEGIYPYSAEETGVAQELPGIDPIMQYIPRSEFNEAALASLEGKPVTVPLIKDDEEWHQWRNPENALRDALTVGTIAGTPTVTADGCIECDMLIMDPGAIQSITSETDSRRRLVEVSAGYDGQLELGEGEFAGELYHGTQTTLRFNHVLLLPQGMGRCGYDVRIINKKAGGGSPHNSPALQPDYICCGMNRKQEGAIMPNPKTIAILVGNTTRKFRFTNEADAEVAENMLEEERHFNAEALQAAVDEKAELEAQIEELKNSLDEKIQIIEAANSQIEELLSPAAQEAMANEIVEQQEAEEVIIEAETENIDSDFDEEEKEEFHNSLKKCRSLAERRALVVTRVMNNRGMRVRDWSQDALDGAFEMLFANARGISGSRRVIMGKRTPGKRVYNSNRDRVLRPMKAGNHASAIRQ